MNNSDDTTTAESNDKPMSDVEDEPEVQDGTAVEEPFSEDESDQQDTTCEQVQLGVDMQGIPWNNLHLTRDKYRLMRLREYPMYLNVLEEKSPAFQALVARRDATAHVPSTFYHFARNYRAVRSKIVHFQLRNLVWSTSKNDVFVVYESTVSHWSPLAPAPNPRPILDLRGMPFGPHIPGISRVQISTLCVKDYLLAAGGFGGELVVKRLDSPTLAHAGRVAQSDNGITNGLELPSTPAFATTLVTSNNDCAVRLFDLHTFQVKACFPYPWAVNYSTVNPARSNLIAVVGDEVDAILSDTSSGSTALRLAGHLDYSFAAAWHQDGNLLATGNQDTTTRVWDIRQPRAALATLHGTMGAIRSTRFDPTGRFLAVAEPADFVHIYDIQTGFKHRHMIDLFGEIAGISFSPEGGSLFVGVADAQYSSLLCFQREHRDWVQALAR